MPTPEQFREMQRKAAESGMVPVPHGQEGYLECPKCNGTEFELKSTFKMVFDRLAPKEHGMVPGIPSLLCPCGHSWLLDPVGDSIIIRDIKAQLLKGSPTAPKKT